MSEKKPTYYKVQTNIIEDTIKYLSARPWNEVNGILAPLLNTSVPIEDSLAVDTEEDEGVIGQCD